MGPSATRRTCQGESPTQTHTPRAYVFTATRGEADRKEELGLREVRGAPPIPDPVRRVIETATWGTAAARAAWHFKRAEGARTERAKAPMGFTSAIVGGCVDATVVREAGPA